MRVLLSIKPEFAEKIFSGEKKYEYRKTTFTRDVTTVVVYATQPVGRIVGEFEIERVLQGVPSEIWEETKGHSGISKDFFSQYFSGRRQGYAIKIKRVRRYSKAIDPHDLQSKFTAPQSFRYIDWPCLTAT